MEPAITLGADTPDEGFAGMLAELIRQNLGDHPAKKTDFNALKGRVAFVLTDLEIEVTLDFRGGHLVIYRGIYGIPDVTLRTSSELVMKMSLIELGHFGLPNLRGEVVREVLGAIRGGQLQGHGVLGNLPFVARFTRVMSVNVS
jgi:hypothetical protein